MIPAKALLGLLARGEQHGYGMKQVVSAEYLPYWRVQAPQLYRSLGRMARDGWVKARVEMSSGPGRKVYHLTPLGRKVLDDWLAQPARDHEEFFVKWRMGRDLGQPMEQLVAVERARLERRLAGRAQVLRDAQDGQDISRITIAKAAFCETQAEIASLELCEAILAGRQMPPMLLPSSPLSGTRSKRSQYA